MMFRSGVGGRELQQHVESSLQGWFGGWRWSSGDKRRDQCEDCFKIYHFPIQNIFLFSFFTATPLLLCLYLIKFFIIIMYTFILCFYFAFSFPLLNNYFIFIK